ncbi:MAG: GLUG motif-containing protein, partial [Gammaproteobacteria bacterium]
MTEIDCSFIANFNPLTLTGGSFDGKNVPITNLYIDTGSNNVNTALFSSTHNATVKNVYLKNAAIKSKSNNSGFLVGYAYVSVLDNNRVSGTITQSMQTSGTGGLVGKTLGSRLLNNYVENITLSLESFTSSSPTSGVGGLVGVNSSTQLENNHVLSGELKNNSTVTLKNVGGLIGLFLSLNQNFDINQSSANVIFSGNFYHVGGLVGSAQPSQGAISINQSFAMGTINTAGDYAGGLIGYLSSIGSSSINNSYSQMEIQANTFAGGLVGSAHNLTITNSYATGLVNIKIGNYQGGLVAYAYGTTVSKSFWDVETTKQTTSAGGGGGVRTQDLRSQAFLVEHGWDFSTVWRIFNNNFAQPQYQAIQINTCQDLQQITDLTTHYEIGNA